MASCVEIWDFSKCLFYVLTPTHSCWGVLVPLVCPFPLAYWKCLSCVCVVSFLQFRAICSIWRASSFYNVLKKQGLSNKKLWFFSPCGKHLTDACQVRSNQVTLVHCGLLCSSATIFSLSPLSLGCNKNNILFIVSPPFELLLSS